MKWQKKSLQVATLVEKVVELSTLVYHLHFTMPTLCVIPVSSFVITFNFVSQRINTIVS